MFSSHSLCDVIYDKRVAIGKLLIICSESKSLFIIEFLFWSIVFTMAFWNMTYTSVKFKIGLINLSIKRLRYLCILGIVVRLSCTHKYLSMYFEEKNCYRDFIKIRAKIVIPLHYTNLCMQNQYLFNAYITLFDILA